MARLPLHQSGWYCTIVPDLGLRCPRCRKTRKEEATKISLIEMGVSKNNGTPKWMVKIMENPIKKDDLGGNTPIFGNTQIENQRFFSGDDLK